MILKIIIFLKIDIDKIINNNLSFQVKNNAFYCLKNK